MRAKNKISELERKSPYPYGKFLGSIFILNTKFIDIYNNKKPRKIYF